MAKQDMSVMFRVRQTGVKRGGICAEFKLPENVYKRARGGRFYVMTRVRLYTNSINVTRQEVLCVQDEERCELGEEKCETCIVQSSGSVLVRTKEPVRSAMLIEIRRKFGRVF